MVDMGCISLWVGFGLARMESESNAVRRSDVWALGFKDPCPCGIVVDSEVYPLCGAVLLVATSMCRRIKVSLLDVVAWPDQGQTLEVHGCRNRAVDNDEGRRIASSLLFLRRKGRTCGRSKGLTRLCNAEVVRGAVATRKEGSARYCRNSRWGRDVAQE
jgi:hypothetical protein